MEDSIRIYLLSFLVGLVSLVLYVIFLAPRYIVKFLIWMSFLNSKFRLKKNINLGKDSWAGYAERGDISTTDASVLLLHSLTFSSAVYIDLLKTIPENYHVVAVDLLNHGDSSAITDRTVLVEDMVQFLKKFVEKVGLHRRKFHLVSFSYGTAVATLYTSKYSDDVASLALCAPPHLVNYENAPKEMIFVKEVFSLFLDQAYGKEAKNKPPQILHPALMDYMNSNCKRNIRVTDGLLEFNFTKEMLNGIDIKTLVVWGNEDDLCLFKGIDHFKENLPNCECYVIKNCGHVIFETHFEESSKVINDWLTRQAKEPTVPRSQGLKPSMK